jgi:inosose dehydratase
MASLGEDAPFAVVEGCHRVARAVLAATGVRTVFHHHCAGWVETPSEIDRLMSLTDPELLSLCFDTGHYTYGGGDALLGLRRHASRIAHVHFKDASSAVMKDARERGADYFEAVRRGVFCELGRGVVPFGDIVKELTLRGYDGWIVVEQDVLPGMGTPFESARKSRDVLRGLGLAASRDEGAA